LFGRSYCEAQMVQARKLTSDLVVPPFDLYQMVTALEPLFGDGKPLPAGSTGTIVDICKTPGYLMVEFIEPFQAVVTVQANQIR